MLLIEDLKRASTLNNKNCLSNIVCYSPQLIISEHTFFPRYKEMPHDRPAACNTSLSAVKSGKCLKAASRVNVVKQGTSTNGALACSILVDSSKACYINLFLPAYALMLCNHCIYYHHPMWQCLHIYDRYAMILGHLQLQRRLPVVCKCLPHHTQKAKYTAYKSEPSM